MSRKASVLAFDVKKPIEDKFAALEEQAYQKNHATAGQQAKAPEPKASAPMRSKHQETPRNAKPEQPQTSPRIEGDGIPPNGRGIVELKGRILADGSRRGAKAVRKMTVHLDPATAEALQIHAIRTGRTASAIIDRAVAAYLDHDS